MSEPRESEIDNENSELSEFSYLKTGGFSSERFKIEVKNLPKHCGISEFRKFLKTKACLRPIKIKQSNKANTWMYVSFPDEDERVKAISVLNGYQYKKNVLKCQKAQPAPDPLVKKRKHDAEKDENNGKKVDSRSQEERLKDSVIPYWNLPYEEQINLKKESMRKVLLKVGNELWKNNSDMRNIINSQRKIHDGLICELGPVAVASKVNGYRNKCEFTIGIDQETQLPTVGLRLGTYINGYTNVAPVDNLPHISEEMKKSALMIQEFVRSSNLMPYIPENHSGHWKQLAIRQSNFDRELMLIISIVLQDLDCNELKELKEKLVKFITEYNNSDVNVKSIYFMGLHKRVQKETNPVQIEHLYGQTHIHDSIHSLKFRISPQSFFQINTAAAEILYQTAIDLSQPLTNTTVLDVCCGTGTIGICFSKYCDQVLGLESVSEAVEDAKINCSVNNCLNAEFFVGKAEEILPAIIARAKNDNIVAIVDPPRAGLQRRAIVELRRMKNIKKLVYISCDPNAAMKNFIDLGSAPTKTMFGQPFFPKKAIAVDMFPYTNHCELIIYFERLEDDAPNEELSNTK